MESRSTDPARGTEAIEIDLRQIVGTVATYWRWVVIATVIGASLGFAASLLTPRVYQASANVSLLDPDLTFNIGARIRRSLELPPIGNLLAIAESPSVLGDLETRAGEIGLTINARASVERRLLEADIKGELLHLTASESTPGGAANVANLWADIIIAHLEKIYGLSADLEIDWEEVLQIARGSWIEAQAQLIESQAENPEIILIEQLSIHRQALSSSGRAIIALQNIRHDINRLEKRLGSQEPEIAVDVQDEVATLLIGIRSLSSSILNISTEVGGPIELQAVLESGSRNSTEQMLEILSALRIETELETERLMATIPEMEGEILRVQSQLEQAKSQQDLLESDVNLARENFENLAQYATEQQLIGASPPAIAEIVSYASRPLSPQGPGAISNIVLGGAFGMSVGMLAVIAVEWWRRGRQG